MESNQNTNQNPNLNLNLNQNYNQNQNPQGGNPDEIIKKQKQDMVKLAQIIKDLQSKNVIDIKTLKEENNNLKEEIKNMEKTTNDMMKHMTKGDLSDLTYIQKQHDNELISNKEIIKNLTETIREKNEEIEKFSEEIIYLRGLLEEEKKKTEFYFNNIKNKLQLNSQEVELYKLMSENSSLKTKQINLEEKFENKKEYIKKLKEEINNLSKNSSDKLDDLKIELNLKEKSYMNLIKDYHNTTEILYNIEIELEKKKVLLSKTEEDFEQIKYNIIKIEKENFEIKNDYEKLKVQLKGKECEVDILAKKLKETEMKALDFKLTKQIFNVKYNYLTMTIDGCIIMEKEKENGSYYFVIENKTSTRTFKFIDVDIWSDNNDKNKFFVKFLNNNSQEEYYYEDVHNLIEYFEDFRRKSLENIDARSFNGTENLVIEEKKKVIVKNKMRNLLEF
jgi:hypothetical protein